MSVEIWRTTLVWALLDAVLVPLLVWRVPAARFRHLKGALFLSAGLFWGAFSTALTLIYWDSYYLHFRPGWSAWLAPLAALVYAPVGLGLWALAKRLPGYPAASFLLLGSLEGLVEHLLAIYRFGILEKVPMLSGNTPAEILVFSFVEYLLYWSAVLVLAVWLQRFRKGHRNVALTNLH